MFHQNPLHAAGWSVILIAVIFLVALRGSPSSGAPDVTPAPTPVPGSIEGNVFVDLNGDGKWRTTTEPGLAGVTVSVPGSAAITGKGGYFKLNSLPADKTYTVQVTAPAGYIATVASRTVTVQGGQRVTGIYFSLVPAATETPTPTATVTSSVVSTVTPTETATATPTPTSTATATPTITPTSTFCPQTTPEPLWVEPVTSPTDLLSQTVIVRIGNGDAVTVTTASGVFTRTGNFGSYGNPAAMEVLLLADTMHHLSVAAHVRRVINWGGCTYGDYTLSTDRDRNGAPLIIRQITVPDTATPTATVTPSATPTVTPQPQRLHYLPLILR